MNALLNLPLFPWKLCLIIFLSMQVTHLHAAPIVDHWRVIQEAFFNDKTVLEDGGSLDIGQIKIEAPVQAEDASLVPFAFKVTLKESNLVKVYLFTDANPILHTATFHLLQPSQTFSVATRIRLEKNSVVRVIAETEAGQLFMATTGIKTPGGGCGGGGTADEATLRASAGQMKLRFNQEALTGLSAFSFHIKHPMRTGFERTTQGYYAKAWYINRLHFSDLHSAFLHIDVGPGISADPYFKLMTPKAFSGSLQIEAADNEGQSFQQVFAF